MFSMPIWNAYAFGVVIRAYAYVNDFEAVWDTWQEMRERRIRRYGLAVSPVLHVRSRTAGSR